MQTRQIFRSNRFTVARFMLGTCFPRSAESARRCQMPAPFRVLPTVVARTEVVPTEVVPSQVLSTQVLPTEVLPTSEVLPTTSVTSADRGGAN